jgi:hypothetical protein
MPPAIIALGLVATEVVSAAVMGYIAVGVTVAGLVTGNKTLQKIGGQIGIGAGLGGIATSFMSGGASAASAGADAAGSEVGANFGDVAPKVNTAPVNAGISDNFTSDITTSNRGTVKVPYDVAPGSTGAAPEGNMNAPTTDQWGDPLSYLTPAQDAPPSNSPTTSAPLGSSQGTNQGSTQGVTQGSTQGATQGANAGNVPNPNTPTPDSGYFYFPKGPDGKVTDLAKMYILEGGKVVAGGLQGLSNTSNMNTQLAENRRIGDIQRANAASVGQSNYGLMRR